MDILIESSLDGASSDWRQQAEHRVRAVLRRMQGQVQQARIRLRDVNGPKGGVDKRCQIQLVTDGHGTLVVEASDVHELGAFNRALQRASQALTRRWQRRRKAPRPSAPLVFA